MSTEAKHTAGPWSYNILPLKSYHRVPEISIYNADGNEFIRQSYDTYSDQATLSEADACLIAAAPDMLEALEEVVALQEKHRTSAIRTHICMIVLAEHARAIIAKAKGEQP
jgi:hypothetical protein